MGYQDDQFAPGSRPRVDPQQLALLANAVRAAQQDRQNAVFLDQSLAAPSANAELQTLPPVTRFNVQDHLGAAAPTELGGAEELATRVFSQPMADTGASAELAARVARARNIVPGEGIRGRATLQSRLPGQTGREGISRAELAARVAQIRNGMPPQGGAGVGPFIDPRYLAHVADAAGESPWKGQPAEGIPPDHESRAFSSGPIDTLVARAGGPPPRYVPLPAVGNEDKVWRIQELRQARGNGQAVSHDGPRVFDAKPWVEAPSRIPRPAAGPDVKPNLRVRDSKQLRRTLAGLIQGIREAQRPGVLRHLTPADAQEAAHESYFETQRGSVAEHEAIISTMVNRLRSPQRRHYVDRGQEYNVHNVVQAHARHGIHQFQGIDNQAYPGFENRHDQGAQNARTAAANIAAHGPTNNATAFIVTDGRAPTRPQVTHLGHVHFVGRVGNVFLYAEDAPSQPRTRTHRVPGHHPAAHSPTPQRRR